MSAEPDYVMAYGDPNESSVGTTKITFDRLMKLEDPGACIALYSFFCYTARWQKTEQAKCTTSYAANALGWGERTVQRIKGRLMDAGLVENVKHVDQKTGQVKGWYIRVRHLVRMFHPAISDGVAHPAISPQGGDLAPKCLKTNNLNAEELVIGSTDSAKKKESMPSIPPELEEEEGFREEWEAFMESRKKLRKPLTTRAAELNLKTLSERPQDAVELLQMAIESGWLGLKWHYLDNAKNPRIPGSGRNFSNQPTRTKPLPSHGFEPGFSGRL